ncbi:glycosyltransferase family 2 protein, partial [bacterium]|nr:glycosyltransferase family 2 protein [bacterium]
MKVSVAINNYNYGKFIVECIESVLHQTYQNIEIIVVDDGSTDDSLEILASRYKNNPRIQIVSKKNAGQLSAFNEALKHITGEIVFFLDADDLYKKNYIETILKVYKENQDVDFVFCAL